jgi:hypothetical protein
MGLYWPWGHIGHGVILTIWSYWPWGHIDHGVILAIGLYWPWGHIGHGVILTMGSYWPWGHIGHGVILTMGSYWLNFLKTKIKAQLITMFFFSKQYFTTRFVPKYRQTDTTLLRNFRIYTEADREIYRKWITKSKQYSTTLHVSVSDYFTHSIIICSSLFITVRYVTLRTSQNLTKQNKNYLYYIEGTVGSIWPQAEINTNEETERHKN